MEGRIHGPVLYHLDEQYAPGLLRPIVSSLHELQRRTQAYRLHLRMTAEDQAAVAEAGEVLEAAHRRVQEILERRVRAGDWKQAVG